jgi:diguanylate cyclase (GGDEF)-like protein
MNASIETQPKTSSFARSRDWRNILTSVVPRGQTLPHDLWQSRHQAVLWLLVVHAGVILVYGLLRGYSIAAVAIDALVPALGALAASRSALPREVRSCIGATSLMLTSAVIVHLSGGYIEAHFHFFAMVPIIALYEDWAAFGCGVGVVLLHHGAMGTVAPHQVYDHANAWEHPWRFAFIHAALFAAACVGSIVNWNLHEKARKAERDLASEMAHRAHHDALTGLPNRARLLEHGQQSLAEAAVADTSTAVLMIDLDRFKEINDVLGHASGDALLARVGPLFAAAVRDIDIVARLGGDEFAAVLTDTTEAEAVVVAQRLLSCLSNTIDIAGIALDVEASVGIAVAPPCDANIDQLLRQADIAMYTAKRSRLGIACYAPGQDTATREHLTLLGELRQALTSNEIVMHYQPKIALPSADLSGVEALARWQHPTRGLLSPAEFIPAAESTGLIVPLTLHTLDLAIAQARVWSNEGHAVPVAVNLSPRCLAETNLTAQILETLSRHGVTPNLLKLEITENTLASDPARALATLTQLDAAGVRISIDDFGTGYSSMSYLKRLPADELKVDQSFISGMLTHPGDYVLVRSLIELGHNLGLTVVAEGVEDAATLRELASIGCDTAQGYHVGRPMPAKDLCAWFARHDATRIPLPRVAHEHDGAVAS